MERAVSVDTETITYAGAGRLRRGIKEMRISGWQVKEVQERPDGGFEVTFVRASPDSLGVEPADWDPAG